MTTTTRPAPTVFLIRHARTALNADGRLRGHLDPPLDQVGRREARHLAAALPTNDVTIVVSSPLQRALQTAAAISERFATTTTTDARLIDRDYARWAGTPENEVINAFGTLDAAPGVEPADTVAARARAALDDALALARGRTAVLVAHDAVNRLLLASLLPDPTPPAPIGQHTACWNLLAYESGHWYVLAINQTAPGTDTPDQVDK